MIRDLTRLAGWAVADFAAYLYAQYAKEMNRLQHGGAFGDPITPQEQTAFVLQVAALAGTFRALARCGQSR